MCTGTACLCIYSSVFQPGCRGTQGCHKKSSGVPQQRDQKLHRKREVLFLLLLPPPLPYLECCFFWRGRGSGYMILAGTRSHFQSDWCSNGLSYPQKCREWSPECLEPHGAAVSGLRKKQIFCRCMGMPLKMNNAPANLLKIRAFLSCVRNTHSWHAIVRKPALVSEAASMYLVSELCIYSSCCLEFNFKVWR